LTSSSVGITMGKARGTSHTLTLRATSHRTLSWPITGLPSAITVKESLADSPTDARNSSLMRAAGILNEPTSSSFEVEFQSHTLTSQSDSTPLATSHESRGNTASHTASYAFFLVSVLYSAPSNVSTAYASHFPNPSIFGSDFTLETPSSSRRAPAAPSSGAMAAKGIGASHTLTLTTSSVLCRSLPRTALPSAMTVNVSVASVSSLPLNISDMRAAEILTPPISSSFDAASQSHRVNTQSEATPAAASAASRIKVSLNSASYVFFLTSVLCSMPS